MKTKNGRSMMLLVAMSLGVGSMVFGQTESTVERLQQAIKVSRELASAAETPKPGEDEQVEPYASADREDLSPKLLPRQSHLIQYTKARPWAQQYGDKHFKDGTTAQPEAWPTVADGAELSGLLNSADPTLRGMAAEALATLYRPEDVAALACLLGDTAEAAPILGYNWRLSSRAEFNVRDAQEDKLTVLRSWHKRTVATYARAGLELITGREFADEAAFRKWWQPNANARHCLWYWQQRIQREMDATEQVPGVNFEASDYRKQVAGAKAAVAKSILAELEKMPPEVEAKVRLLTTSKNAGGAPITGSEGSFWPEPPSLRMNANRLLELLDRKGLWEDVVWDRERYNLFAERLGIWANVLFQPEHIPRLSSALQRERGELWWSGQAALIIGISRLLPPATDDKLDQPDTRDGSLRAAVLDESELFVRSYCAMELVRVGLPRNAGFLKRMAFEPIKDAGSPTMSQAILQALAEKPLSKAKCELLVDIVLDERFKLAWTRRNERMGDDMDRQYATVAINAHAGRVLITEEMRQALVDPARSAKALKQARASVEKLRPAK